MYIGPFYFDTKELFLILAAIFVFAANYFSWDLWWFDSSALLTILILILLTKGLLPALHNENFLILSLSAVFLTIYLTVFQVILFYIIGFALFRIFRII
ncbi:MAG: hypothetical protein KatS3mg090_0614 [Patescibacteria group bacterium]|nr:MAG: hypothetical protein KatS3mg090_0614 [Patescibacteria group bacterium]